MKFNCLNKPNQATHIHTDITGRQHNVPPEEFVCMFAQGKKIDVRKASKKEHTKHLYRKKLNVIYTHTHSLSHTFIQKFWKISTTLLKRLMSV